MSTFYKLTEREYHADPCPQPSFSASCGKTILSKSPLHAYLKHPRLGGAGKPASGPTPAMLRGSILHKLILGEGAQIACIDAENYKGGEARAARDLAVECGALPVLKRELDELNECKAAFDSQLPAQLGDEFTARWHAGESEAVIMHEHANLKGEGRVWARSMLDRPSIDDVNHSAVIFDVKTTANAHPDQLERTIYELHYEMQMACYEWQLECVRPDLKNRIRSIILFIETEPPYSLVAVELDGMARAIGRSKLGRAWDAWCECIASGAWPSYSSGLLVLGSPAWAQARELDDISA